MNDWMISDDNGAFPESELIERLEAVERTAGFLQGTPRLQCQGGLGSTAAKRRGTSVLPAALRRLPASSQFSVAQYDQILKSRAAVDCRSSSNQRGYGRSVALGLREDMRVRSPKDGPGSRARIDRARDAVVFRLVAATSIAPRVVKPASDPAD